MKDFIKQNWYWIGIIIVLFSALFTRCNNDKATKKDSKQYTTVSTKKEALEVMQVPETIVKKFTEIKTITKFKDIIKIDTIKIVYKDSIPCSFERTGELKTKEYSFTYESNNKGFKVSNLDIQDSLVIVTGIKRKWFLGKQTNTIDISHSNKYISSQGVRHVEIKEDKKFYETTLFKFGLGLVLGIAIAK
jgi:hypothetical protein